MEIYIVYLTCTYSIRNALFVLYHAFLLLKIYVVYIIYIVYVIKRWYKCRLNIFCCPKTWQQDQIQILQPRTSSVIEQFLYGPSLLWAESQVFSLLSVIHVGKHFRLFLNRQQVRSKDTGILFWIKTSLNTPCPGIDKGPLKYDSPYIRDWFSLTINAWHKV